MYTGTTVTRSSERLKRTTQAKLLPVFAKEHVPRVLKQLEHLLKQNKNSKGYFVYEHVRSPLSFKWHSYSLGSLTRTKLHQPSFSEFHLYYLLYALGRLNPNALSDFPELAAWKQLMGSRPGIKAYEASGRRHELLNGSPSAQNPCV